MTLTDVDEAIRELLRLSQEPKWSRTGIDQAHARMRTLRASGFTNEDVSTLAGQRWSTDAVKKATTGTKVTSPEIRQQIVTTLSTLIGANIPITQVQSALNVLSQTGDQLPLVLEFLATLKEHGITLQQFFENYGQMTKQNLTPPILIQGIQFKNEYEKLGFNPSALSQVKLAAEKYGNFAQVMAALNAYGSLDAIRSEATAKKKELDDTNLLLKTANNQLTKHQQLDQLSTSLATKYTDLQRTLNEAITNIPSNLKKELENVANDFKRQSETEIKAVSETFTKATTDRLKEADSNLKNLSTQFTNSQQTLERTVEESVKKAVTNVESLKTKAEEATTQITSEFNNKLTAFQQQTNTQLTGATEKVTELNNQLQRSSKTLTETVNKGVEDSKKNIEQLTSSAVEAGKKMATIETQFKESQPYLELLYLCDSKQRQSVSPKVLAVMKVLIRGFLEWTKTTSSIRYHNTLENSGSQFLKNLEQESSNV
jgi:hypothetical protein